MRVTCPYCGGQARLVLGAELYPGLSKANHKLRDKKFWRCDPCDAHVGTHAYEQNDTIPLGRLANAELRRLKMAVHRAFDPVWKRPGARYTRTQAYQALARRMDIPKRFCHIGLFDEKQCREVLKIMKEGEL